MKGISAILLCSALTLVAGNKCPSGQETNWDLELLLRHEDCEKFYKCTFGEPVEQLCPAGLFFNLELWQCDWQQNVDCSDRNVPGEEKPEPAPEVEEEDGPDPVQVLPELPESEPEVEEEDGTDPVQVLPELSESESSESSESSEEEEDGPDPVQVLPELPESESSEEEEDGPDPVQVLPELPESEPEVPESEEEPEIEFQENGCPVNPHVHWLLPHEVDCNLFYYCVWGEKVQRQCPSSLHFNRNLQVCDWPWDAGCHVSANKHVERRRALLRGISL